MTPLGISCMSLLHHACDSGFTVARGPHFPVRLWSPNRESLGPHGKKYTTLSKIPEIAPHHGANSILTRRVPSPRNNAVTRANKTPSPFPRPLLTRPVPARASAECVSRVEEAADLSVRIDLRRNKSTYSLPQQTNHPSTCTRGHLQLDGQYPQRAHHWGGGPVAQQERLLPFIIFVLFIFFYSMLAPYPPPSLLLLTSTTGRLMIVSWTTRRF